MRLRILHPLGVAVTIRVGLSLCVLLAQVLLHVDGLCERFPLSASLSLPDKQPKP